MKIFRAVLFFVCTTLLFTTCKKPAKQVLLPSGAVTITFVPTVGSEPFSLDSIYYASGVDQYFYFDDLQLYLSNLSLVKSDNTLVPIDSVLYFYYPSYMSVTLDSIPAGTYKGIQFSFGLDPSENNTNPASVFPPNPLSYLVENGMYWSWLKYRFMSLSGRLDTSAADSFVHGTGLDYHVGTDTCYRQISPTGNGVSVTAGGNANLNINLDVQKIFYNSFDLTSTDSLNMFVYPGTQSVDTNPGNDIAVAIHFANQITHAFSYSQH